MASKYVAARDFETFTAGDDVTVAQAGDNAESWLADGLIVMRDASVPDALVPDVTPAAQPTVTPLETPEVEPAAAPAAGSSFVTLGSSPDGMPRFVVVEQTDG